MESNLATIDRTFHDLALLEREEPKVSDKIKADAEKASKSVIAGFDITNEDARKGHIEKARETRRSNVIKYLETRSNFTGELNKLGVEPMAVLPSLAWVKLWKDAGLFYVSTTTGKVQCRMGPSAKQWMDQAYNRNYSKSATDLDRHRLEVALSYVKKYTLGTILEEMATDRCFYEGNNARIILPQAPADVIQTLIKVKGLSPKTVAVPEAISFAGGAGQVIADMHKGANAKDDWARAQGYEDYKDWLRRDPIVFVEKEGVTAIVGQFGDFPIESELVDRVSKEDFFAEAEQPLLTQSIYQQQANLMQAQMNQLMQAQMNQQLYGAGGGGLLGIQSPYQYQGIGHVTSGIPNTGWNVSTTYR